MRWFFLIIIIGLIGYGVHVSVDYVKIIVKKRGLEEKVKETAEYLNTGTSTLDKAKSDIFSFIIDRNINVDSQDVKIEKNPSLTYIYIYYYDSLIFPLFKKSKIIYFDFEIAETLYVR